jgi:hypothetical protein
MSKELTSETDSVVSELRACKNAVELLYTCGPSEHRPMLVYALGRAISRLCLVDVNAKRDADALFRILQIVGLPRTPNYVPVDYIVATVEHLQQSVKDAQKRYVEDHREVERLKAVVEALRTENEHAFELLQAALGGLHTAPSTDDGWNQQAAAIIPEIEKALRGRPFAAPPKP